MTEGLEGGCLCGKVRFRTTQAPLRTIACHCTFCQRVTGSSYYAESMFPMNAVVLNDGALSSYAHISDGSRKKVFVHFCPNCGTTVSLTFERWPEIRGISRGCYDDPNAVEVSSVVLHAIQYIKLRLFAQGGVVKPRNSGTIAAFYALP